MNMEFKEREEKEAPRTRNQRERRQIREDALWKP